MAIAIIASSGGNCAFGGMVIVLLCDGLFPGKSEIVCGTLPVQFHIAIQVHVLA
jgi:hypothetical protein